MACADASPVYPSPVDSLVDGNDALRVVLDEAVELVGASGRISLAITGGAAAGFFDDYSDIDLVLAVDGPDDVAEAMEVSHQLLVAVGKPLAIFPADHLGASNLFVAYLRRGTGVLKLDILVLDVSAVPRRPDKLLVIQDAAGRFARTRPTDSVVNSTLLLTKLVGWLWFSYARIRRGELFAAARSLDFSREVALLPLILDRLGLPQEGHRRLEVRLPERLLAELKATHPARLDHDTLMNCLLALRTLTVAEIKARLKEGNPELLEAVDEIWNCIEISEREYARQARAPIVSWRLPNGVNREDREY